MGEMNLQAERAAGAEKQLSREAERKRRELIQDIVTAKNELFTATQNFDFADCDEMVDLYSHRIIAAQTKYNLLMRKAKESGISCRAYLGGGRRA